MVPLTLEEKKQKVWDFRPLDDVFFEVLADDNAFCQEILRVILSDDKLIVNDVIVQGSRRNLYGRSIRLDALCTLGNGKKVNIEVQRSQNDNHVKRVRFNAAIITARESQSGERFEDIPEIYIVYISEFDIFRSGSPIYHVESVIRETGEVINDGLHRIFVNTASDDGSDLAVLMSCFTKRMFNNPKFPVFSKRMKELKEDEGGVTAVCEIMQKYEQIAAEEGRKQGREEGRRQGREEGREEGRKQGREEGREEGRKQGREEGHRQGREEGRRQGLEEGREEGFAEMQEAVIRRMLLKQKTPQEIQDLCGFDIAKIEAVSEKMCTTV